jgi:hypothetical protein
VTQRPEPWFHRSTWWGTWSASVAGLLWWIWSAIAFVPAFIFGGFVGAIVVVVVSQGVALLKSEIPVSEGERGRRAALRDRMWRR